MLFFAAMSFPWGMSTCTHNFLKARDSKKLEAWKFLNKETIIHSKY